MQLKPYLIPSTFLLLLAHAGLCGQNKIIWGEAPGKISMANLDGSEVKNILQKHAPVDLVADSLGQRVYWTENANNFIFSTGLDDKAVVKVYPAAAPLQGLTIDQDQLFFVEGNGIVRLNLSSRQTETLVSSVNAIDVVIIREQLYWSEPGAIKRLSVDGQNTEGVLEGLKQAKNLIYNVVDQKLYFYDNGKIYKVNPDGTQLEFVVEGTYFSLDKTGRKLLLTSMNLTHNPWGGVSSIHTDGSNRQRIWSTTISPTQVVGLGDKIFWIDPNNGYNFLDYLFSSKTPSGYDVRASSPLNNPTHLAIDPLAKHIYWVENGSTLKRTTFVGEEVQNVYTIPASQKLASLALDYKNKKLYWSDNNINTPGIYRMNTDGSGLENISNGVFYPNPSGLALQLDQNQVYWSDPTIRRIIHAELSGKNPGFIELTSFVPESLVLDKKGAFLYFMGRAIESGQTTPAQIFKVPTQGGTVEIIHRNSSSPLAFAIDQENEYLYWTFSQSIKRADLNGDQVETILDVSNARPARYLGPIQIYHPEDSTVPVHSPSAVSYKLSPNPFHTDLRVEGLEAGDQVLVYSLLGQNYGVQKADQTGSVTISGHNLPPGMAYLYIKGKNGKLVAMKIYKY